MRSASRLCNHDCLWRSEHEHWFSCIWNFIAFFFLISYFITSCIFLLLYLFSHWPGQLRQCGFIISLILTYVLFILLGVNTIYIVYYHDLLTTMIYFTFLSMYLLYMYVPNHTTSVPIRLGYIYFPLEHQLASILFNMPLYTPPCKTLSEHLYMPCVLAYLQCTYWGLIHFQVTLPMTKHIVQFNICI